MLKIIVVTEDLLLGGAQSMSVELANALGENEEHQVLFAASDGPLRERLKGNVTFVEIPLCEGKNIFRVVLSLKRIIDKFKPDVIHSQSITIGVLIKFITLFGFIKKARLVITHHSKTTVRLPYRFAMRILSKSADKIIAISKHKYEALINAGIPRKKLTLIPNFIDLRKIQDSLEKYPKAVVRNELGINDNTPVIMMAGRLMASKRFDRFIEIVESSAQKLNKQTVGLILGEGEDRDALEIKARNTSMARFIFLGYQKNIFKYLKISNLFLFPSEIEVLPMTMIEASAAGVPIVCSDIPGNNDIVVNGRNGFLVSGDNGAYCERIAEILNNKELAANMGVEGQRIVSEYFEKNVVTEKIVDLYENIL